MNVKFTFLGPSHTVILILTVALTLAFIFLARRWPDSRLSTTLGVIPGAALLAAYVSYNIQRFLDGYWEARYDLPMELCSWAAIAVIITCFTRNQFAFELAYFWVMAGSIHGTLTPNLQEDFPHFYFFIYLCLM
ncbi:MAG: YwaF family protein [Leptospirales bacterium]|nr:YwaF family protein [Leptospirales bacterium]